MKNQEKNSVYAKEKEDIPLHVDSLSNYLTEITNIPPLSPDEQQKLNYRINENSQTARQLLARFKFVAAEYLRIIGECVNNHIDPADFFLISSFNISNEKISPADLLPLLIQWKNEIEKLYSALSENSPEKLPEIRKKLSNLLEKYAISGELVNEFFQIIVNYLKLIRPNFDPAVSRFQNNDSDDAERTAMIEDRFGMSLTEAAETINSLIEIQRDFSLCQQQMIEGHLRLVVSIAQKYRNRGIPFNDLIQEGNLGLLHALEKFDAGLGNKFSTYASWWIRHHISRAILEQSRVIRIPAHMIHSINAMNWAEQRFIQANGREPAIEELAGLLELPVARVSALRKMAGQTISLQAPISNQEDSSVLEDLISDNSSSDPVNDFARRILYEKLYEMLETLPERDRQIIVLRFGLYGQEALPLVEISRRFNLTRERIRQLEVRILESMRTPAKLKFFDLG